MNIILFRPLEVELPLSRQDPRARHLLTVLRRQPGDTFDAGIINGPRGKGTLVAMSEESLTLSFRWNDPPPALPPLSLLVGLPRPQTARDILRDATSLGTSALHFVMSAKTEVGYANSSLWRSGEWEECVINGAAQAFCTQLPSVSHGQNLAETLKVLAPDGIRLALDNYEAPLSLFAAELSPGRPVCIAIGSERGWSPAERDLLRQHHFLFVHLGSRVLRTETACLAALILVKAKAGWL